MAVYKIVEIGADVLRLKAKTVKEVNPSIIKLLDNMIDTLHAAEWRRPSGPPDWGL